MKFDNKEGCGDHYKNNFEKKIMRSLFYINSSHNINVIIFTVTTYKYTHIWMVPALQLVRADAPIW